LLGGIAGLFAAFLYYKVDPINDRQLNYRPEEIRHLPYWMYEVEGDLKKEYRQETKPKEEPGRAFRYLFVPRNPEEKDPPTTRPEGDEE
jgi:hypothetical protein